MRSRTRKMLKQELKTIRSHLENAIAALEAINRMESIHPVILSQIAERALRDIRDPEYDDLLKNGKIRD